MTGKDLLFVLAFLAAWIVLNRWVLPWLGVPTCMGGSCGVDRPAAATGRIGAQQTPTAGQGAPQKAPDETHPCCTQGDLP